MENCRVRRLKRKSNKSHIPDPDEDFENYLINLKSTHQLEGDHYKNVDDEAFQQKMREKWKEHKSDCYLVEILTGLQAAIQGICENVVLLDRVEFLKEKGFHCRVEKVTNDQVSPRCHALIAVKQ
ncbi:hypothetical protein JTB14_013395 [Gonioctena quinquepunctata]|nr:hypothetical protein JTB14_013395 [Gonioctena quinquepunctata]